MFDLSLFPFHVTLSAGQSANQTQRWQGGHYQSEPHDERATDRLVQSRFRLESHEGNFEWTIN